MFRPTRMVLVTVWLNDSYAEDLFRAIGNSGIAQTVDSEELLCGEADTGIIQRCSGLLERMQATFGLLQIAGLESNSSNYQSPDFDESLPSKERLDYVESRLDLIEGNIGIKRDEIGALLEKEVVLFTNKEVIKEAENQDIRPKWMNSDEKILSITGLIDPQKQKRLKEIIKTATNGEYVIAKGGRVKGYGDKQIVTIVTLEEYKKDLEEKIGVIQCSNPLQKPAPAVNLRILEEIVRKEQDFAVNMKRSLGLLSHPEARKQNCILQVWVPRKKLKEFKSLVQEVSSGKATVKTRQPNAKDEVPILLDNPLMFKAFEPVVEMFSPPQYDEIDPTPIVAVSTLFFFGFMFGDLGHGILMLLAGIAYMHFGESAKKTAPVVIMCSLAAIIAGLIFGSFLGFEGSIMPVLGKPEFDVKTLLLVMSIGLAHMSLGAVLGLVNQMTKEEKTDKTEKAIGPDYQHIPTHDACRGACIHLWELHGYAAGNNNTFQR